MGKIALWRQFSDDELKELAKTSTSFAEVATKMGYRKTGSTTTTLKQVYAQKEIDTSHFLGQSSNKGKFDYERFKYGNNIKASNMKDALVALKGHKCEKCGLTHWFEQLIPLEVHHNDGDHLNNEIDNLCLLCPNCHALTENWRGKNISKSNSEMITEEDFVKALQESKSVRQALLSLGLTGAGGNYDRAYNLINKYKIIHLMKK